MFPHLRIFFISALSLQSALVTAQDLISTHFSILFVAPFDTIGPGMEIPKEPELYYLNNGRVSEATQGEWNVPTTPMTYMGTQTLQFFTSRGMSDGKPLLSRHSAVTLPNTSNHLLLVFFLSSNGDYSIVPVDVGIDEMPKGSLKLINFSGEDLAAQLANQQNVISHQGSWIVPTSETENYQVSIKLAARKNDDWRLIYRTSYAVAEDSRFVLFVHKKNFNSGPFRVRRIAGFGEAPEASQDFDIEAMEAAQTGLE